jgi:hypothetical protein
MTTLEATPFSDKEREIKYELNSFIECGMPFSIMVEREMRALNTGNSYKFGVLSFDNKNLSWLFYGEVVATTRLEALKLYQQLLVACEAQKLGRPFAYKVMRRK